MTKMAHIVGNKVTFVDLTDEQKTQQANETAAWNAKSGERKLTRIREIRLQKLKNTDYMALGDYTMPDYIKTWRQSLRDIPANYNSSKYDELLAEDSNGNFTHSIWTQPTS